MENLVGYMRRNYFVPVPEVASFEELNQMLIERLQEEDGRTVDGQEKTIGAAWQEEKLRLLPLPRFPFLCCVSRSVGANHLSLVTFDGHRYSVPVEYGFSKLTLHAYAWRIDIACGDRVIATHERRYGKAADAMEIEHYLPLLVRRPGAFPYAKPVRQWQMPEIYRQFYDALSCNHDGHGVQEFLQVLTIGRHYGRETLEQAMGQALAEHRVDSERIRQLVAGNGGAMVNTGVYDHLGQIKVILPNLSQFDRLRPTVVAGGRE